MSRLERVLAIDPGKMTGVVLMQRRDKEVEILWSAELQEHEVIPAIREDLKTWDETKIPLRVVIERFTVTVETAKKANAAYYSIEMIGAVKQACRDVGYPLDAIVMQTPAQAKSAYTNERLRDIGLWHRGGAGHALDAIRHGLLYLVKSGLKS